jgi:hypothetical protein
MINSSDPDCSAYCQPCIIIHDLSMSSVARGESEIVKKRSYVAGVEF